MRNIRITFSYDGSLFFGSQSQKNGKTVQGELEKAVHGLTGERTRVTLAGRTDRGVHAINQVANFRTRSSIPAERFHLALNGRIGDGIYVKSSAEVPSSFDARRSARKREYVYYIYSGKELPVIFWGRVLHVREPLSLKKISEAAKFLKGKHDFSKFCAMDKDQKNFVRRIHELKVSREMTPWGGLISIRIKADAFLYKMVRFIVGTLLEVGKGKMKAGTIRELVKGASVKVKRTVVPSCGLYLSNVEYEVKL